MEGEATGLAVATGAGVGAGLFGTSGFGSQAPNTAVETAKTVDKTKVLLIVILLNNLLNTDSRRPLADIRSRNERDTALSRFAANLSKNIEARHRTYSTLRPIERACGGNLQEFICAAGSGFGDDGRLPGDDLPDTFSFNKGAGVEVVADGFCSVAPRGVDHQFECNDGCFAVLMYLNILGGINGHGVAVFARRSRVETLHHFRFICPNAGRACIDEVVGPETFVDGGVIAPGTGEEFVKQSSQLCCVRGGLSV